MEIWKDIKGYEGLYQVSNLGNVKSLSRLIFRNGKYPFKSKELILKPKNDIGYLRVTLRKNNKSKLFSIHRLVLFAFLKNHKNKPCVNHKNGIKSDNRVENLEWVTVSENVQHSFDVLGRKNSRRLLKESDIPKIKKLYSQGYLQREIGHMYGIKRNTISRILRNISYGLG